jgi:ATP phosphoribosyltransferase regulatory subunit
MATKFRYPTGARPLLIEETARRRRIESRFVALLEEAGFAEIVLPVIDFAEPYASVSARGTAKQSYRFTDREGELVAIRSDFTPMVARALAPYVNGDPLRVFYRGDVIRCEATRRLQRLCAAR